MDLESIYLFQRAPHCNSSRQILPRKAHRPVSAYTHTAETFTLCRSFHREGGREKDNEELEICCDSRFELSWFQ